MKNKIIFLAKNILNEKIPIEISQEYQHILKKIVKHKYNANSLKIILCEDHCISSIFERACKKVIKYKNESK